MNKKIICLGMMLLMIFLLSACNTTENLASYKNGAKASLTDYAQEKDKTNYSENDWFLLQEIVEKGKADIDNATSQNQVDTSLNQTKQEIDAIKKKYPFDLSDEALKSIRKDYFDTYIKANNPQATVDDVPEFSYYGTFNDCVVMRYKVQPGLIGAIVENIIADVYFYYGNQYEIFVWENGDFYDLQEAYDNELLTRNDIITIMARYTDGGFYESLVSDFAVDKTIIYPFLDFADDFKDCYYAGEELSLEGVMFKCVKTSGFVEIIDSNDYTVDSSGYDKNLPGIYKIYIVIENFWILEGEQSAYRVSFNVEVKQLNQQQ